MRPNFLRVPRGELRLFVTLALCISALIALSSALAWQLWPEEEEELVTVSEGVPFSPTARPEGAVAVIYEICNLTNELGAAVFVAAWADGNPNERTVTIAEAGLAPAPLRPGCQDIIVERTAPRSEGTWRRVGVLDVRFPNGLTASVPFVSGEIVVIGE